MSFLRCRLSYTLLFVVGVFLLHPLSAFAQIELDSFSLAWNGTSVHELVQGDCYDLHAGPNAGGITLDIRYRLASGFEDTIVGWPTLDSSGTASNICTGAATSLGNITFLKVRDTAWGGTTGHWYEPNYVLTMYPQATGASLSPGSGFAGIDSYVFHVANIVSRNVRIRYNVGSSTGLEEAIAVDGSGDYHSPSPMDHYTYSGSYLITAVKDAIAQTENWVGVNAGYTLYPPEITSFWLDKSSITAGGANGANTFHAFGGNGADVTIDYTYTLPGGSGTQIAWPTLEADGGPGWEGRSADIQAARCTLPGPRWFDAVRNTLNTGWVAAGSPIEVLGAGPPVFSTASPPSANQGQELTVTLNGQNLCGVLSMQTNYSGLTFTGIAQPPDYSDGTSFTATFQISSSAAMGNAAITLHARGGDTTVYFGITQPGQPAPTITGISPTSGARGNTVPIVINGTNLIGPALSTTWAGEPLRTSFPPQTAIRWRQRSRFQALPLPVIRP